MPKLTKGEIMIVVGKTVQAVGQSFEDDRAAGRPEEMELSEIISILSGSATELGKEAIDD